jgi:hypothetical protein
MKKEMIEELLVNNQDQGDEEAEEDLAEDEGF